MSTLAGSGVAGFSDGVGTSAQFNAACNMWVLPNATILVTDEHNNRLRIITNNTVRTVCAGLGFPTGVIADVNGTIFVAEDSAHRLSIARVGSFSVFAGSGSSGNINGIGTTAAFVFPVQIAYNGANRSSWLITVQTAFAALIC